VLEHIFSEFGGRCEPNSKAHANRGPGRVRFLKTVPPLNSERLDGGGKPQNSQQLYQSRTRFCSSRAFAQCPGKNNAPDPFKQNWQDPWRVFLAGTGTMPATSVTLIESTNSKLGRHIHARSALRSVILPHSKCGCLCFEFVQMEDEFCIILAVSISVISQVPQLCDRPHVS